MITDRIDRITDIPPAYKMEKPPAPKSVKIELTGKCNYRCGFCALRTREVQPKQDMSFALFQRITTDMRESGVEEIGCFYLGEPFMAPELLEEAIKWLKTELKFPYVFLTTNGSLCTRKSLRAVMEAGLDSLKFSVNACDEDQFKQVMGVKPSLFAQALEAIRIAWDVRNELGSKCGLYASSIRYDGEQHKRMEELLDDHVRPFVDEHYWLPLYSMGSVAAEREAQLGYRPIAGNQGRLGRMRDPLPCWSAFTEGHVTADGILSACCFDADGRWAMGDLKRESFMEAWHSPTFTELRSAHLAKDVTGTPCEKCVAYA